MRIVVIAALIGGASIAALALLNPRNAAAAAVPEPSGTAASNEADFVPTCEAVVAGEPESMTATANLITNDPSTWPNGDRVWDCCRAIAMAEGANIFNSNPDKLNNPGDISDGAMKFGSQFHSGSNITHFPDKQTGWQYLYDKVNRSINGNSSTYPKAWTITKFSQTYAANWQNWKNIVGQELGVDPDTTSFSDYVQGVGGVSCE